MQSPYWPTSATNFGGQIGASPNGDSPGDIYRLAGGVVLRPKGNKPLYAGYLASAFILPGGTRNNRVVAPGSEDLTGADGREARFFLVPVRPGTVYEQGATFVPAFQIDPVVPARIAFNLTSLSGRRFTTEGAADGFGNFAGREKWVLDEAGVYEYTVRADWNGFEGLVPGLGEGRGSSSSRRKGIKGRTGLFSRNLAAGRIFRRPGPSRQRQKHRAEGLLHRYHARCCHRPGRAPVAEGKFAYRFEPSR